MRNHTTVLVLLLLLAGHAFAQDQPEKAVRTRRTLSSDHVAVAGKNVQAGLWEEARYEYQLALALSGSNEDATTGLEGLDEKRILNWSKALHEEYRSWRGKHLKVTKGEARKLAALLKKWPEDQPDEGAALAKLAIRLDADCKPARKYMGEEFVKSVGWVPAEDAKKYKRKMIPWGKGWVRASTVAGKQPEWKDAWVFRGEDFVVHCNAGQVEGRTTLAWAEDVHHAFRREFRGLLDFEPPAAGMKIYHFKDRADLDEHNRTAHGDRPGLRRAPGFFSNEDRIGHFFPIETADDPNLLEKIVKHETTHQLAYYAMPASSDPTGKPHF